LKDGLIRSDEMKIAWVVVVISQDIPGGTEEYHANVWDI
jgi:hypothetical protein